MEKWANYSISCCDWWFVLAFSVLWIRKFSREFYFRKTSHMRSFVKIKPSRNGKITLSFTYVGNSCPSSEFLASQLCLLTLMRKIFLQIYITCFLAFSSCSLLAEETFCTAVSCSVNFSTFSSDTFKLWRYFEALETSIFKRPWSFTILWLKQNNTFLVNRTFCSL